MYHVLLPWLMFEYDNTTTLSECNERPCNPGNQFSALRNNLSWAICDKLQVEGGRGGSPFRYNVGTLITPYDR